MAFTNQQQNSGSFVPTSYNWDVSRLYEVEIGSPEFKELIVRLYQYLSNIAIVLNTKDSAFYVQDQFLTGQVWFNPNSLSVNDRRIAFRKVVNVGTLGAGITTIAHNLGPTNQWKFTYIGGVATNTATLNYYPLPFVGAAGFIELRVNGTNVIINNTTGIAFTDVYVVLEFLKS